MFGRFSPNAGMNLDSWNVCGCNTKNGGPGESAKKKLHIAGWHFETRKTTPNTTVDALILRVTLLIPPSIN